MCAITRNHYSAQCGQKFYQFVFEFYTHNFTRFNVFFHSLKDRRYKEYLVKLSDRISKMQQQKSFKLIVQEQQLQSRAQCAFLQDLFHFLRFFKFVSRFPELFKNISASVDLEIRKLSQLFAHTFKTLDF